MKSSTSRTRQKNCRGAVVSDTNRDSLKQKEENAVDVKSKRCAMIFSSRNQMTGLALFSCILVVATAYPFALPLLFIIFAFVGGAIRFCDYWFFQPRKIYFLFDLCYAVNAACCGYLMLPSAYHNPYADAVLYALADGPVAFALYCWSFPWAMWSQEYCISVLVHVLPGLAMFAHHHLPRLSSWGQLASCTPLLHSGKTALRFTSCIINNSKDMDHLPMDNHWVSTIFVWLVAVPLLCVMVHLVWYFLMVELIFRKRVEKDDCHTSFTFLYVLETRHTNNPLARIALRTFTGSRPRVILVYGSWVIIVSFVTFLIFLPTYFSWHIALMYQIGKIILPLYKGIKLTCNLSKKMVTKD